MDKIFPSHIYKFNIDTDINKDLISEIYQLKEKDPKGLRRTNRGGWHSDTSNSKFKELSKLLSEIVCRKILNLDDDIFPGDIWANINPKDSFNMPHIHNAAYFSGVYYVKVPENSGNLFFVNPFFFRQLVMEEKKRQDIIFELDKFTDRYWSLIRAVEYEPKEGDVYFFMGNTPHAVSKNLNDDDRISISFNFNIDDFEEIIKGDSNG